MGHLYHGYVSHNQMVCSSDLHLSVFLQEFWPDVQGCGDHVFRSTGTELRGEGRDLPGSSNDFFSTKNREKDEKCWSMMVKYLLCYKYTLW